MKKFKEVKHIQRNYDTTVHTAYLIDEDDEYFYITQKPIAIKKSDNVVFVDNHNEAYYIAMEERILDGKSCSAKMMNEYPDEYERVKENHPEYFI